MTHIFKVPEHLSEQWENSTRPGILATCTLVTSQVEYARIITPTEIRTPTKVIEAGEVISAWRSREFPGCAIIAATTDVWVVDCLRGGGVGSWLRDLRTRAYREAGFRAEVCTVRTDNPRQEAIMRKRAQPVIELPSDRGGSLRMWITKLEPDSGGCTEHGVMDCGWCALWDREDIAA